MSNEQIDLHTAIMNLPVGVPPVPNEDQLPGSAEVLWSQAYKVGHRDARHDAAELALAHDARIRQLEDALTLTSHCLKWWHAFNEGNSKADENALAEARAALNQPKDQS